MMQKTSGPSLRREIGATSLALNAINLTVGSGIFVLPAIVAMNMGAAGFIAYLLCGLLVVLIMLCYAEVGSKVITTGGSYAYVEKAFGPLPGFLINTLFWVGFSSLADAAVINAMTDMIAIWFPLFKETYIRTIFFILVFGTLVLVNIRGVKQGAGFAVAATILKLTPLLLLVLIGLFSISTDNLSIKSLPTIKNAGETALGLFFAFMGIETALSISGEIKEPRKNIPKGIFMGVTGVLVIYLLLQFVVQGVLGDQIAAHKDAPLAALGSKLIGPAGETIILATSVVSMFGLLCGDILASPRILFAASRDKLLPGFLGKVHPKFATPYWSIIVYAATGLSFGLASDFKRLAVLASSSILIIYLAVALATIRLRFRKDINTEGSFTIPGGITIPILAVITIGWFLSHITRDEIIAMGIFFAALTAFYFINRAIQKGTGK
jgi:basic amino acid/polyamine antiporter, APA family